MTFALIHSDIKYIMYSFYSSLVSVLELKTHLGMARKDVIKDFKIDIFNVFMSD